MLPIPPELLALLMGQGGGTGGGQLSGNPQGGTQAQLGANGVGFFSGGNGASLGMGGLNVGAGGKQFSLGPSGFSMGSTGSEDSDVPGPQHVFRKLMKRQYPVVSQSADRLAGIQMREASRGANAAGMGNSAVLQSIRDAAFRSANEEKAGARDQFLQQAFDITGARQKAAAFQTMMDAARQQQGGSGGGLGGLMGGGAGGGQGGGGMLGGLQGIGGLFGLGNANKPQEPSSVSTAATQIDAFLPGETEEQRRRRLLLSGAA